IGNEKISAFCKYVVILSNIINKINFTQIYMIILNSLQKNQNSCIYCATASVAPPQGLKPWTS
ncbi:MAG: hypothetical protein LBC68_05145, partial [Prevotellaceae bacterium]|nr:hypothetical protein [Prevotellaceae bacterium]